MRRLGFINLSPEQQGSSCWVPNAAEKLVLAVDL